MQTRQLLNLQLLRRGLQVTSITLPVTSHRHLPLVESRHMVAHPMAEPQTLAATHPMEETLTLVEIRRMAVTHPMVEVHHMEAVLPMEAIHTLEEIHHMAVAPPMAEALPMAEVHLTEVVHPTVAVLPTAVREETTMEAVPRTEDLTLAVSEELALRAL